MTKDELRQKVNEIIQRTRNQNVVQYEDVDMLIVYIDFLEYELHRYEDTVKQRTRAQ
jgi:hypothetical protein